MFSWSYFKASIFLSIIAFWDAIIILIKKIYNKFKLEHFKLFIYFFFLWRKIFCTRGQIGENVDKVTSQQLQKLKIRESYFTTFFLCWIEKKKTVKRRKQRDLKKLHKAKHSIMEWSNMYIFFSIRFFSRNNRAILNFLLFGNCIQQSL